MQQQRQTKRTIRFAHLFEVNEGDPPLDRKCEACRGQGECAVIDANGEHRGNAICPACGGTRYAS